MKAKFRTAYFRVVKIQNDTFFTYKGVQQGFLKIPCLYKGFHWKAVGACFDTRERFE